MPTDEPAPPLDIALTYAGSSAANRGAVPASLRVFGVVYSLELFRALALRLPPGSAAIAARFGEHVDVEPREDGSFRLFHFRPRAGQ